MHLGKRHEYGKITFKWEQLWEIKVLIKKKLKIFLLFGGLVKDNLKVKCA